MAIDIVIDIETLGTKPGCVILEIGACAIDPDTGAITANFSRRLDEVFVNDRPFDADMRATIEWWHGSKGLSDTYSALIRRGTPGMFPRDPRDPRADLEAFAAWFKNQTSAADPNRVRIWANGPQFDFVILRASFDRYGVECPWPFWQERCVRTALEMADYKKGSVLWSERGPRHRALNDARHEARKLCDAGALGEVSAIRRRLREREVAKGEAR